MNAEIASLFNLSHSLSGEYFKTLDYPWQALSNIQEWVLELGKSRHWMNMIGQERMFECLGA